MLATLPGAIGVAKGRMPTYDAPLAVLTATLIALIWYSEYTFQTLHHYRTRDELERSRARTVLATGLLGELQWIEGRLEQVRKFGPYSDYDPLEHPVLETVLVKADVFAPKTVSDLARFHALLRDVRSIVNAWRSNPDMFGPIGTADYYRGRKNFKHVAEAKAHFALNALPALVESLVGEGGTLPARDTTPAIAIGEGDLPPLPDSALGPRRTE